MRTIDHPARHRPHSPAILLAIALLSLVGLEFWAIRELNDGTFLYSLDDAYVHLSLAERMHHGHYGINAGQPSSPASSILWPALLAPLATADAFPWLPLVLNLVAAGGVAIAVAGVLRRSLGVPEGGGGVGLHVALGVVLLVLFNTVGLVFTGLEHSLQVWLTLLAVLELHAVSQGAPPRPWLWPVLVLGPLVRYENLAVTLPSLAFLAATGRRRESALSLAALITVMGDFTVFLVRSGLPVLPSSVIAKGLMGVEGGSLGSLLVRFRENLLGTWSGPWLAGLTLLLAVAAGRAPSGRSRWFAIVSCAVTGTHLVIGGFGMFHRYELYAVATGVAALALIHGPRMRAWLGRRALAPLFAIAVLLLLATLKSAYVLAMTPAATHEVYRQQFQMRRFARELVRAPVGVNDLGLVAFGNPHTVVDLWGLANPEALAARRARRPIAWADSLCRREGVVVAMVYRRWFGELPERWTPLGALRFTEHERAARSPARAGLEWLAHRSSRRVVVAQPAVDFYAIRPEDVPGARALCERFREHLPDGVRFDGP